MRMITAGLVVLVCWILVLTGGRFEGAVLGFLTPPPDSTRWLVSSVWYIASFGLIATMVLLAALSRQRLMARDVVVSGLSSWLLALAVSSLVGSPLKGATPARLAVDLHYPQVLVAVAVAVALAGVPYLSRGLKRAVQVLIILGAIASIVHGSGLLFAVLASVALGWGVAAAVALAFGSPLGMPSESDVTAVLEEMGIPAMGVRARTHQEWGVARFVAADAEKRPMLLSVYGRDARDAQLLSKAFRYAMYRDSGPTLTLTRLQQVEHEAYLTLRAAAAGAEVPEVLQAGRAGSSGDAVLAVRCPPGRLLAELIPAESEGGSQRALTDRNGAPSPEASVTWEPAVSDQALDSLFENLLRLRKVRIAHGGIDTNTIVVGPAASALVEFRRASSEAAAMQLDRDVACALAAAALAVGIDRSVGAARRVLPKDVLAAALPFLHRAALTPSLSRQYRGRRSLLPELRAAGARAADVEQPKLAETRRISWVNLALLAGTLIGGWALVGVLVNVGQSINTIAAARWGWVVTVAVLATATYPALATEVLGAVLEPLPVGRVVALELADTFVALAGGTMAVLATRVRFFQQQGLNATLAVSSGILVSTVSWIVKGGLFLVALPLGLGSLHFNREPSGGGGRTVWLVVIAVSLAALGLGLVLAVPRLRRMARDRLRPKVSDVLAQLRALATSPRKLVQIFGGALAAQVLVALALGAALQAFGDHLSFTTIVVVITLASMLGGISPVPGGVGVVEAGMIVGLTAAGISEPDAVAAVFVQRLFTSYLPPVAGWIALVMMRRREYI